MTYPVQRLSHVASTKTSNVDKKSYDDEVIVRLCNYTDVYKNDVITSDMDFMVATASQDQIATFGLKAGDTVFTKDSETADDIGIPAYIAESAHDLVCGYHLAIARPFDGAADPRFLYWCLASPEAAQQWSVLASGVTRVGLRQADIGKLEIPVPPLQAQREVAAFLDRETAQIDDLIVKQERLIELLAEKRQAVITHAVTKGLDPSAPTKPSGVPWLGDVPEHWSVRKFSQVTFINGGQVDPRVEPWASMLLIAPNHVESGTGKILYRESSADQGADSGKYFVKAGEVIYSKIRPYLRKVVIAPEDCLCSADMYGINAAPGTMSNRFLQELMLSQPFTDFTRDSSARVAMPKINRESLAQGFLWYPPRNEQDQILAYIDRESELTAQLQNRAKTFIELLRERRSALISAAVTGKINVQEGAA